MLGDREQRAVVLLVACAVLGVVALTLVAVGIEQQTGVIGRAIADLGDLAPPPPPTPDTLPTASPPSGDDSLSVPDSPEPAGAHGPIGRNGTSWITSDDYPIDALRNEQEGAVKIELQIDATGRVTACSPVERSGVASLDAAGCRLALTRARFYPARDAAGRTRASVWYRRIVWRLPG